MNETEQSLNQQVRNKNRKKLVQQNLKLITQLKRLETEIQAIDSNFSEKKQQNQHLSTLKIEADAQQRQIKQLKELIENEKHANLKQNVMYIRKEEDELIVLKRQLQNLTVQKSLVANSHSDKLKKLGDNEPLQKHKQEIQTFWAKTKKQNRQLNLKMVQMQRQIRKYHNLKEISKGSQGQALNYKENQLKMTNSEIQRLNNQMKAIEAKWKTNINQLDKEFFTSKNTLNSCQKAIQQLQREEEIWKRRSSTLRDQNQLQSDRARLSKITSIKNAQEPRANSVENLKIRDFKRGFIDLQNAKKASRMAKLASSLSRVQSSPNPPTSTKKSLDIKQNGLQFPVKKQQRYKIISKERKQKELDVEKGVSFKEQKNLKTPAKSKEKSITHALKSEQHQAKKETESIGPRQKHRIKSIAASHLAQSLKRKAQEVKQLNKKLQIQEERYEKGKHKKQKNSQSKKNQHSIAKIGAESIKSLSKVKKGQIITQGIQNSPQLKKQKSEKQIEKHQLVKAKSKQKLKVPEEKKVQHKELVQDLQFNKKVQKKQKSLQKNIIKSINKEQKIMTVQQPVLLPSKSPKQAPSPKISSPKNNQNQLGKVNKMKQKIQYLDTQKLKPSIKPEQKGNKINLQIQLEDLDEGKPKIIKRKRLVQGNLVTTGTST